MLWKCHGCSDMALFWFFWFFETIKEILDGWGVKIFEILRRAAELGIYKLLARPTQTILPFCIRISLRFSLFRNCVRVLRWFENSWPTKIWLSSSSLSFSKTCMRHMDGECSFSKDYKRARMFCSEKRLDDVLSSLLLSSSKNCAFGS
jgi:hypothetical protein